MSTGGGIRANMSRGYGVDVDATADRVYVVGDFYYVDGIWSIGMV